VVFADRGVGATARTPSLPASDVGTGDRLRAGRSPALWCDGVRKRYGRHRLALQGVGLEVARGEVLGLLGPNGAGKTTLIKILLGLVRADAGEVMLLGRAAGPSRSRVGVGYLPELFRFQPWLTADEVLRLHARLAKVDWPDARRRSSLAQVGLAERAQDRVGSFSKGMQQRLGLAVALVGDPELVVLDEPTSALDPLGRADVRDLVVQLRERGTSVVLNSHLIGEVERVCDRVVILDGGRVAAAGTLEELLGRQQVRLRLDQVGPAALERLARTGAVAREGDRFVVDLDGVTDGKADGQADGQGTVAERIAEQVADLVADLVGLGVRVHGVEPARISLEDRLLGLLRGSGHGDGHADGHGDGHRDGHTDAEDGS
jgi:ABC-2 type transport system ATP-binding protein